MAHFYASTRITGKVERLPWSLEHCRRTCGCAAYLASVSMVRKHITNNWSDMTARSRFSFPHEGRIVEGIVTRGWGPLICRMRYVLIVDGRKIGKSSVSIESWERGLVVFVATILLAVGFAG